MENQNNMQGGIDMEALAKQFTTAKAEDAVEIVKEETSTRKTKLLTGEDVALGVEVDTETLNKKQPAIGDLGPELQQSVDKYLDEMDAESSNLKNYKQRIENILSTRGVDITDSKAMGNANKFFKEQSVDTSNPDEIESWLESHPEVDLGAQCNSKQNAESSTTNKDSESIYDNSEQEFNDKYNEAVVLIDKMQMGTVINFTQNERAKLEKSRVIKLKEVEVQELGTMTLRKAKEGLPIEKLLKKSKQAMSTPVVCVASGYSATVMGASSYEIIEILKDGEDAKADTINKWRMIYDKIDTMSIGKPETFEEWLSLTATADYQILLYGLLTATYPDEDSITFQCNTETCKKEKYEFEHVYTTRSLIRVEEFSDKFRERFETIADARYSEKTAKDVAALAPVNTIHRYELPETGIRIDFVSQSAYDFIHRSLETLTDDLDEKYATAVLIAVNVKAVYIPDYDAGLDAYGEYGYFEITDNLDIIKTIQSLPDRDLSLVAKLNAITVEDLTYKFGLMNIKCPKCGRHTTTVDMDLERILFQRLQRATDIVVE